MGRKITPRIRLTSTKVEAELCNTFIIFFDVSSFVIVFNMGVCKISLEEYHRIGANKHS